MTRSASIAAAWLVVGLSGCGPSPKPKPVTDSIRTDGPQPESTEWLFATPGSSGVVKQECKVVVNVLEGERTCSGDLCQHAINLGQDWLKTCRDFEKAQVPAVEKLVSTFRERLKVSGGECAFTGAELIDKGCPEAEDCAVYAQRWATHCSDHASPLIVRMIEKQVESSTQTPIKLDTTSCPEIFAKVTESVECGNDFECEEKLAELRDYQARCTDPNRPVPLDDAIKEALLLRSAKQAPPAVLVKEARFGPEKGRLLLDDASGFVISVGDQPAPNVNILIKTLRDSEYVLPITIARVFSDGTNRHYLRIGAVDAPDPATFFRRFPSLKLAGQAEALKSDAANASITKLNDVVKHLDQQEVALAGLIASLTAALPIQDDKEFQAEVAKADKHLVRVFERLATTKRQKLPKPYVKDEKMRDRVAYARRSWLQPFADVNARGQVELGATTPAVLIDVEELLPISFAAYHENMDGTIGKALRSLEAKYENGLIDRAQTLADSCAATRKSMQTTEQELLACAFGIDKCEEGTIDKMGAQLDEAAGVLEQARAKVEVAVLELEKPPKGKLEQSIEACNE